MKKSFIVTALIITAFLFFNACKEDPPTLPDNLKEVSIISLTAVDTVLNAWQTTQVTIVAEGDSLEYSWEADHGEINGSGPEISYMAGTCCVGINTITCTVTNPVNSESKQIKVRVLPF